MGQLINTKLKAFTLIESIVSLTLISVVVGISLLLINKVGVDDFDIQKAKLLSEQYYSELEMGIIDGKQIEFVRDDFTFDIQAVKYNQLKGLYEVKINVGKNGKVLYKSKKLLILNEN